MRSIAELVIAGCARVGTQGDVAKALGVNSGMVSEVISGKSVIPLTRIDEWADALQLKPEERAEFRSACYRAKAEKSEVGAQYVELEKRVVALEDIGALSAELLSLLLGKIDGGEQVSPELRKRVETAIKSARRLRGG